MLRPLHTAVGLGEIPAEYTNNPNESANTWIKPKLNYQKSESHVLPGNERVCG